MKPGRTDDADDAGRAQLMLGTLLSASRWLGDAGGDTSDADDRRPDLRYIALGAACAAEARLGGLARATVGATRAVTRPVVTRAVPLIPGPVRRAVVNALTGLDEQGRAAATAGSERARHIAAALADDLSRDPILLRTIGEVVAQVRWQVVDAVLPTVLERLADEPEQVRGIVQGQSRGIVEELTQTARARAVAGDDAVDRFLARLLRRSPARREPQGPSEPAGPLPAGPLPEP